MVEFLPRTRPLPSSFNIGQLTAPQCCIALQEMRVISGIAERADRILPTLMKESGRRIATPPASSSVAPAERETRTKAGLAALIEAVRNPRIHRRILTDQRIDLQRAGKRTAVRSDIACEVKSFPR